MKVVRVGLEIGHGPTPNGYDPGAISKEKAYEHALNVLTSFVVRNALNRLRSDKLEYQVKVLDVPLSLREISQLAGGFDVFVSLHLNAFNCVVQGSEVLVNSLRVSDSSDLAEHISAELRSRLGIACRGVKQRSDLAVLKYTPPGVAACLVESFFMDSAGGLEECFRLTELAANGIAAGIDNFSVRRFVNALN